MLMVKRHTKLKQQSSFIYRRHIPRPPVHAWTIDSAESFIIHIQPSLNVCRGLVPGHPRRSNP